MARGNDLLPRNTRACCVTAFRLAAALLAFLCLSTARSRRKRLIAATFCHLPQSSPSAPLIPGITLAGTVAGLWPTNSAFNFTVNFGAFHGWRCSIQNFQTTLQPTLQAQPTLFGLPCLQVQHAERTVREIATLNQMFSTTIMHQSEQIEKLYTEVRWGMVGIAWLLAWSHC